MSLQEELYKRLDSLKKAALEYKQLVDSIESKKIFNESESTSMEKRIEILKQQVLEAQNKANGILSQASDEAAAKSREAQRILESASRQNNDASQAKRKAEQALAEANATLIQAQKRQKEADVMYAQYEEKHKKILEAVR